MNSPEDNELSFLASLDEAARSMLIRAGKLVRFGAGEIIVYEGDPSDEMYVLLSGKCDVLVGGEVINQINTAELFGEIGTLGGKRRTATIRAVAPVEVLAISRDVLMDVQQRFPAVSTIILKAMANLAQHIANREAVIRQEQQELRNVEKSLLPDVDACLGTKRLSIETHWQPLTYASGDYCDVLGIRPELCLVAIGDVMGHGARTVPTLASVRGQLRELASLDMQPCEILTRLDEHLYKYGPENSPISLVVCVFDLEKMEMRYSNAGHPAPLIYRHGNVEPLAHVGGPLLGYGFGRELAYDQEVLIPQAGDKILFYTDGLSETPCGPNPARDMLGDEELQKLFLKICRNSTGKVLPLLFSDLEEFRQGHEPKDDAAALLVHIG